MQILKRLFDFYIYSNIHVAIGAFSFVKITLLSFGMTENETALFVFFSTILSYNFIRFMDLPKRNSDFGNWFYKSKKQLLLISILSGMFCLYFFVSFKIDAIVALTPFVLLTLFYGMKLPRKAVSLRYIPGLKIFVIAFCFAGITVLFPLVQNGIEITFSIWVFLLQRLFFVILITLPFDIRDVDSDTKILKTIPQLLGVIAAKLVGLILAVFIFLIEFIYHFENGKNSTIVLSISFLAVLLLLFSSKNQSKYYSSFWVEALPIFWLVIFVFSLKM